MIIVVSFVPHSVVFLVVYGQGCKVLLRDLEEG